MFKPKVLVVGQTKQIAISHFSLKGSCEKCDLAGGVNEVQEYLDREDYDIVITTLQPPLHSTVPTNVSHNQDLHGLTVAHLATNYDVARIAIVSTDKGQHLQAEIVTETVSQLYEKTGGKVSFLSGADFPGDRDQIDWQKLLEHIMATGMRNGKRSATAF